MIVRTAVRLNCTYAVHASIRIALNSGLSQTEVEALTADGPVTGIDPEIVLIPFPAVIPSQASEVVD
jgi:hypothetical protein